MPESSARFLQARAVVVNAHLAARQPAKALEVLAPLRKAHPDDLSLAFSEALAHADAGDAAAARAMADKLTGEAIVDGWLRARVAERLGDTAGALAILEPALKANADHVGALNLAGYLLAERKERLDDAERYLARARDLQPGDPAILDSWGWLLYQRGRVARRGRAPSTTPTGSLPGRPKSSCTWPPRGPPTVRPSTPGSCSTVRPRKSPPRTSMRRIDALRADAAIG